MKGIRRAPKERKKRNTNLDTAILLKSVLSQLLRVIRSDIGRWILLSVPVLVLVKRFLC
jgi:hypothetical protein